MQCQNLQESANCLHNQRKHRFFPQQETTDEEKKYIHLLQLRRC